MIIFEYSELDGRIFSITHEYSSYEDPGIPIPEEITDITGITDEMVKGHKIDIDKVNEYFKNADIIIAHNASFDRKFIEKRIPNLERKAWGCSARDIAWKKEGIESSKLEYIAYRSGFFYEGHRALNDCLAGLHILASTLPKSRRYAMHDLLQNSSKVYVILYAVRAPFECKDILKSRGYKWLHCKEVNILAWCIELPRDLIEKELEYLRSQIYNSKVKIPFEIIDMYSRFSILESEIDEEKHRELIEWVRSL